MPSLTTRLLAATALCATATGATAQDTTQDPGGFLQLDRIIFGFGVPRVAIDTPQAVTSLDGEDLDRQQATTPAELLDEVPGVQSIGSNRAAGISFNIRGVGELAASDESKIIVTVDGATKFHEQYRVGSFFGDPELYKRVEVLRGPASSTLVGAGALGGAIAFETKDPSDFLTADADNALSFRIGGSSNGEGGFSTLTYAGRVSDRAEVLASLTYRRASEYEDGDGNSISGSDFDALTGLVKGTYQLAEGQSVELSYSAFDSDLDDTDYSQTGTLGFGTIDRRVRDQTLTFNYANTAPGNDLVDLDVTAFWSDTNIQQDDASFGAFSPSVLFQDSEYGYETFGLKVENTSRLAFGGGETFLTYGLQASQQERTAEAATSGNIEFHPEGTDRRIGLYGQAEMALGGLTLIPGIRVDMASLSPDSRIAGATDIDTTSVSPKLAALYQVTPEFSVFGSVSRTERAPTLDELYSTDSSDGETAALTLNPETSDAVELGFAFERNGLWAGNDRLAIKVTGFQYDIDDLIERDSTANTPYYRQIGSARIRGAELEGAYEADRFYTRLAYSYTDGEDLTTGAHLDSIPAETAVLTIGGRNADRTLDFGWQGTLVDDITESDGTRYGGYGLHDVYASYTPTAGVLEGWQVRAGIDNVLDRDYRNNLAGDDGAGRTFKLSLTRGLTW
ncbi:TonB-dependent receptor domain-containing protein [Jannaschia sp. 2305UL9-9]|uniref:TonB-dependent receptor domain-containing protein n=1 Tax=Jannaschia sp. 2305UL9-9 TaxID=3121638 RepID=UPI003527A4FB